MDVNNNLDICGLNPGCSMKNCLWNLWFVVSQKYLNISHKYNTQNKNKFRTIENRGLSLQGTYNVQ